MSEEDKIEWVAIDRITVPRERVTSVWDPGIEEEFMASVENKGILEAVSLMRVQGELYLVDGLHRIQAAERLGQLKVPARIKKGELQDLLIENIIRNRQRGRSNPAQEAEVLAFLIQKRGFSLTMAAKQIGCSEAWARRLVAIAGLPEEIKDYLKHKKLPVTGAFYLTHLPRVQDQVAVANDAVFYHYKAAQMKKRVWQIINPDLEPEPGDITFNEKGAPAKVPLTCHFCGVVLGESESYVWTCGKCLGLARDTIEYYKTHYGPGAAGPEPGSSQERSQGSPERVTPP